MLAFFMKPTVESMSFLRNSRTINMYRRYTSNFLRTYLMTMRLQHCLSTYSSVLCVMDWKWMDRMRCMSMA